MTVFDPEKLLTRIQRNPGVKGGRPKVRTTRYTVDFVLDQLAQYMDINILIAEYPGLEPDDVAACLLYAANCIVEKELGDA